MKTTARVWLMTLFLLAGSVRAATNQVKMTEDQLGDLYVKAVMLLSAGQYDEADKAAKELHAQLPNEPKVIHLQRQIELARQSSTRRDSGNELELRLSKLIVPKVNFREAAPSDVIDWLRDETAKLTGNKDPVNFVWMVPPNTKLPGITLNLRDIPLLDVLHFVTEAAKLKMRIEAHAVVISLAEPATPAAAPAPAQDNAVSHPE